MTTDEIRPHFEAGKSIRRASWTAKDAYYSLRDGWIYHKGWRYTIVEAWDIFSDKDATDWELYDPSNKS